MLWDTMGTVFRTPVYHARDHPRTHMVAMFPAFSCAALRRSNFVFGVTFDAEAAWLLWWSGDTASGLSVDVHRAPVKYFGVAAVRRSDYTPACCVRRCQSGKAFSTLPRATH